MSPRHAAPAAVAGSEPSVSAFQRARHNRKVQAGFVLTLIVAITPIVFHVLPSGTQPAAEAAGEGGEAVPPKPRLGERVTDLEIGAETARSRLDIVERAAAGEHIAREAMVAEQRNLGMAQIRLDGRLDTMDARIGHIEAEGPVRHLEVLDALKELRQDLRDNRRAR